MRRILLLPSLFLLLLGTVCFLISAGPFTQGQAAARPIVLGNMDDIKTLDVSKMSWASDIRVAMALYEGLTSYDTQHDLAPIPAAAARWDISPDRMTYTFHLRPQGRWSNGDPVTADDFIFSWKRALRSDTGADYIGLLRDIVGAEEYTAALDKKLPLPDLGVKKLDDLTLQVQLKAPCTYFLDLVAMPVFFPLHEQSMRPFLLDNGTGYKESFTQPPHLVSNGPFQITEWRVKRDLTLAPNKYYWDRAHVPAAALRIDTVNDSRAALLKFQSGEIDELTFMPQDFADAMLQQQRDAGKWPELHAMPVFGTYYYVFNTARKPFDDRRVRLALALSVDRAQVTEILKTGVVPLGLIVPPKTINGYVSPSQLPLDVARARKLLAEAGFPDGRSLPPIQLLYNSEGRHAQIAQAFGQMWETQLGVKVTYKGLERGSFGTARRDSHDFDIARGGWYGDYPDPTTWLDIFRSGDGNNDGKFSCPPYDDLMAKSDAQTDPAKRFELLRQAEDMLISQEAAIVPLYQYADGFMYQKKLTGAEMNARTLIQLKYIRREP